MWDEEKIKQIGGWILRIVVAGIMIKMVFNVILVQHEYFS